MMKNDCITSQDFKKTLELFIEKPHLVNKQICGIEVKWIGASRLSNFNDIKIFLENYIGKNQDGIQIDSTISELKNLNVSKLEVEITNGNCVPWKELNSNFTENEVLVIIREIIPKSSVVNQSLNEIVVIDNKHDIVAFFNTKDAIRIRQCSFVASLSQNSIQLCDISTEGNMEETQTYLKNYLQPLLSKWARQMGSESNRSQGVTSLNRVDIKRYTDVYQELKRKYSTNLIEMWTEVTDPLKYVYEDIAIASYLIVLWEKERHDLSLIEKQSFVDLGCGNGLLVFLLASEGYPGLGIDVRKRKIWDQFPSFVQLKVSAITPSDEHLYPEVDWLIGNHSDELTPWIPVIAAKSSFKTRIFVIPCCAFGFQSKYQRKRSYISLYTEYLDFVEEIIVQCGFHVFRDRLRIPSTKRICLIGQTRSHSMKGWGEVIKNIDSFIKSHCSSDKDQKSEDGVWCNGFEARQPIEATRNCTQIDPLIRNKIVNEMGFLLLATENYMKFERDDSTIDWNRGGSISMEALVRSLDRVDLKHLKKECGGLQTLLRNHKFIFEIVQGIIRLRIPESIHERQVPPHLLRTKRCWFHDNHPQGCTLLKEDCAYLH